MSKTKSCHVHVDQESSLTRRSHIIAWFVYAYFTVTVGHWWTAHSPGSMPSKRVHVPVLCSVLHWQALALPELPINGDWRLPWWIHQGWPVFPNSRLCWKSHQSSGRHFQVELTCWFFHVTLQEPNKETRKRTSKMKNASKIKIAETLKQMQKKWIQNKPFGSFSEHSGTQSLKVQRDCLDYCFVTSMITTGISGISRWPSRGMSCIGITAAALQSMIDNWQFYFPLSCGSSRGTCCGKPNLELLCKIICYQVQSILDNLQRENGRDVEISVQYCVYNR